jgi:hypothetical protein
MNMRNCTNLAVGVVACVCAGVVEAGGPPARQATTDPLDTRLEIITRQLKDKGDLELQRPRLYELWMWSVAYLDSAEAARLQRIFVPLREMELVAGCKEPTRSKAWTVMLENPHFAEEAAFLWSMQRDQVSEALAVACELKSRRPAEFEAFANVAAALCAVRDRPLGIQLNETHLNAPPATEVFEYFTGPGAFAWGVKQTPPEMLVHVVDVIAPIEELRWAQSKYARDAMVGNRYGEINYDINHFVMGTPKRVTTEGVTLPNIRKYGGVCVDQAYFASEVGKAIGVPSVYVTAESTDVGHAWVGFVRNTAGKPQWDFSSGRHDEYKRIRGEIVDPQYGGLISDGELAVLTEAVTTDRQTQHQAIVLAEAAATLGAARRGHVQWPPLVEGLVAPRGRTARELKVSSELELLEASLKLFPTCRRAWEVFSDLARAGEFGDAERERWGARITALCGTRYPDFAFTRLAELVRGVKDAEQQHRAWEQLAKNYQPRPDLVAAARMGQAGLWEKQKNPDRALAAYRIIIEQLINEGAFAFNAVERCEDLYRKFKAREQILPLYKDAFRRVQRPGQMNRESVMGSSWYRIGTRYAELLDEAGQENEARNVRSQLNL